MKMRQCWAHTAALRVQDSQVRASVSSLYLSGYWADLPQVRCGYLTLLLVQVQELSVYFRRLAMKGLVAFRGWLLRHPMSAVSYIPNNLCLDLCTGNNMAVCGHT